MKSRLSLGVVGGLLVASTRVGQAIPGPAAAATQFVARLNGSQEATAVAVGVTTGSWGTFTMTLNADGSMPFVLDVFNLPSGATVGHIHVGGPGQAGPTAINLPIPANISNDFRLTGTLQLSSLTPRPDQGVRSAEDFIQALRGGQTYVNVHTLVNPGGEIRGHLRPVPPPASSTEPR